MKIFDTLIMDCSKELQDFKSVVCDLDMPIVDLDAATQLIFEALTIKDTAVRDIFNIACHMSDGEGLFENADLDSNTCNRIFNAVETLGHQLKDKLSAYHAYVDNQFPYEFKRLNDDGTIILRFSNTTASE